MGGFEPDDKSFLESDLCTKLYIYCMLKIGTNTYFKCVVLTSKECTHTMEKSGLFSLKKKRKKALKHKKKVGTIGQSVCPLQNKWQTDKEK